jgi:hypothetical protein
MWGNAGPGESVSQSQGRTIYFSGDGAALEVFNFRSSLKNIFRAPCTPQAVILQTTELP